MTSRGKAANPAYNSWRSMLDRCNNQNYREYFRYGGAGIKVYEPWEASFEAFLDHIGPRPSKLHTVDRIDNSAGYFPGNVRWATKKEQALNRCITRWIEIGGERKCLTDWCDHFGINVVTASYRIDRFGWDPAKAVSTPTKGRLAAMAKFSDEDVVSVRRRRRAGEPVRSIAESFGVDMSTIRRVADGRSFKHVTEPVVRYTNA